MRKVKIVGVNSESNSSQPSFVCNHLNSRWHRDFDVEVYDPTRRYDINRDLIWVERHDTARWYQALVDEGFKIIRANLWDSNTAIGDPIKDREFELTSKNWFWFQEANLCRARGYNRIRSTTVPDRFFLMLMNLVRAHRSFIYQDTVPYQEQSLISYVEKNIVIEGDHGEPNSVRVGAADDRFYNPGWYGRSCFSLTVESTVEGDLFVTEKIFKPLAYQHPVIVYGCPGTLRYLRSAGFATFDHVVDERYDTIENGYDETKDEPDPSSRRRTALLSEVKNLYRSWSQGENIFQDPETKKRIEHNYHRFYDQKALDEIWQTEIVDVIYDFAEK